MWRAYLRPATVNSHNHSSRVGRVFLFEVASLPIRTLALDVVRPIGRPQWAMAACLATMLGAILAASAAVGHARLGAEVALAFLLTAVPSLPQHLRAGLEVIAVRGVTVLCGTLVVMLTDGLPVVRGVAIVAAAMLGARVDWIGPTAGLAVILPSVAFDGATPTPEMVLFALWPYAAGPVAVAVAWLSWLAITRFRHGAENALGPVALKSPDSPHGHALRVGVALALALIVVHQLPASLPGTHWLITSVLLTIQPRPHQTTLRIAQRLSGNTLGAVIAAVVLGCQPPVPVVIAAVTLLFMLATALRGMNYTWWAVMGPPALLMVSEYPALFPWYEGGIRVAMNLAGSAIVAMIVFGSHSALRRYRNRENGLPNA